MIVLGEDPCGAMEAFFAVAPNLDRYGTVW